MVEVSNDIGYHSVSLCHYLSLCEESVESTEFPGLRNLSESEKSETGEASEKSFLLVCSSVLVAIVSSTWIWRRIDHSEERPTPACRVHRECQEWCVAHRVSEESLNLASPELEEPQKYA